MHSDFNLTEIVLKHNVTTWSFRDQVVTSSSQDLMRDLHWTLEMDSNQSGAVGETIWDPFQGSLTHLGASGRLKSQIQAIPGQILTFPDPPCQLGQLKWSEMACTGVPQIVLHISYSTRTYWGHFRPCKVSFSALAERSSLLLRQCEFWKYCF